MTESTARESAFLDVLGESGWGLLLDAGLAVDALDPSARGAALAAAERLRKAHPSVPPERRAAALELVFEGARLATKLGVSGERLIAVRGAVEQATAGRVATWHAQRLPGAPGEARVVEIGCGVGGDSIALAHRARNLISCDLNPVRAACAHTNLAAFGLASASAVPADGFDVLAGEGKDADVVFCDPDRRPDGTRTLDPHAWSPSLDRLFDEVGGGRALLVKAASSLDPEPYLDRFAVSYVSHGGECVEAFLESRAPVAFTAAVDDPVSAVLLPADGPSVELRGDRGQAPEGDLGDALYTIDPAAIRGRLLAELATRHSLSLLDLQIALFSGARGVNSPWLKEHAVHTACGIQDVPAELRRLEASHVRVHCRGVAATATELDRVWRSAVAPKGGGPAIDVFVTRLRDRPGAVLASRRAT